MGRDLEQNEIMARWLDGRLTEAEKNELEASGELDALKTVIDDLDTWQVAPFDAEKGLERLKQKNKGVKQIKPRTNKTWLGIAASFALLLTVALTYFLTKNDIVTRTTGIAERETIELPAGTIVQLDARSSLSFNKKKWENKRRVKLDGQAYFDVTSGNSFEVTTKTATVKVLGTQFNVKAVEDRFAVACYEGKISVTYKNQEEIITKGQMVTLIEENLVTSLHSNLVPNWFKGYTLYDKTPLNEVVKDFQNYYDTEVVLPKKHQGLLFTGRLDHTNLELALKTLFTTMELEYSELNGKIIVD